MRAPRVMHGKTSKIFHDGAGCSPASPNPFDATRYHSLVIEPESLPDVPRGHREDRGRTRSWACGTTTLPVEGVQFHPESILTTAGKQLLANFLRMAAVTPMTIVEAIARALDTRATSRATRWPRSSAQIMDGEATPAQIGGAAGRAAREGRDRRRGGRRGARDARARDAAARADAERVDRHLRHRRRRRAARSTSRRSRRSWSRRAAACVAKHGNRAQSSQVRARPTCSRRSASRSTPSPRVVARCIATRGIGFLFAPRSTRRRGTSAARARSSACARSSTCSGR